jgi:protein-tyrosine phosphatase
LSNTPGEIRSVLMICMGNICRSPTAEAVLRHKLAAAGLAGAVSVDSAGTHAWHGGDAPDERSQAHAARRGYDLSALRARRVREDDFARFDLLVAMDFDNLHHLQTACPQQHLPKLRRLMEFADDRPMAIVPDPYYGEAPQFEQVLDLIEQACDRLITKLRSSR